VLAWLATAIRTCALLFIEICAGYRSEMAGRSHPNSRCCGWLKSKALP
jgi:hypothetical protein